MSIRAPRGTVDILPKEVGYWHFVRDVAQKVTRLYGYEEIITPVFEHTELFTRTTGETSDIVSREMYTFEDKSGRSLTLRPEGTPGTGRAYLEHKMDSQAQPTKLYYFGPMFRYERPQAGRQREFNQFGIEVFGAESYLADAEVIALAMNFLERLGLNRLQVRLNSIGCSVCRPAYRARLIDYFSDQEGLCGDCQRRLVTNPLRVLDCKNEGCKTIAQNAPAATDHVCEACAEHFSELTKTLSNLGIAHSVDPNLVRGLDYYTRTVFEFVSSDLGAQNAVFGGGRYDGMIETLGGTPTPGVGWALGIERLIIALKQQNIAPPPAGLTVVYVVSSQKTALTAIDITESLRKNGVRAEIDLLGRSFRSQMKQADRIEADFALFVGEDEVRSGLATIRDMKTGKQRSVSFENVVPALTSAATKRE